MAHKTKMLLVACSNKETADLAKKIHQVLHDDYSMGDEVELLVSQRRGDVDPEAARTHRQSLTTDYFPDMETQVDVGRNELKDVIRGKHVVLVEHMLTPNRVVVPGGQQGVSVNDHLMTVRGVLNVVARTETLARTLAIPYTPYIRSHSIERYEAGGLFQFDSLRLMLSDLAHDGLTSVLTIDPHSDKAAQLAGELRVDFHSVNPFRSGRSYNPYKLGLEGRNVARVLKKLRPFQERIAGLQKKGIKCRFIAVDDGTERRVENFVDRAHPELEPEIFYALIAYLDKDRVTYTDSRTRFKTFSRITKDNIEPGITYVIIDDMVASLGTAMKAAKIFKEKEARIEVWTSHPVTMPQQYTKANQREFIDKVVCLDTVPQPSELDIEYIPASADLLGAGLYKIHQKLKASR
jgi:phosphoribosylpyrophosphate synthetase